VLHTAWALNEVPRLYHKRDPSYVHAHTRGAEVLPPPAYAFGALTYLRKFDDEYGMLTRIVLRLTTPYDLNFKFKDRCVLE
jgi:hypothetical protein